MHCRTALPLVRRVLQEDGSPRGSKLRPTYAGPREATLAGYCACTLFGFGRGAGFSTGAWGASGSSCCIVTSLRGYGGGALLRTLRERLLRYCGILINQEFYPHLGSNSGSPELLLPAATD